VLETLPLFAIPFVFWQFGNRQIFDNVLFDMKKANDVQLSGHTVSQALNSLTNADDTISYNGGVVVIFIVMCIIFTT
jgi:hypothetical protein